MDADLSIDCRKLTVLFGSQTGSAEDTARRIGRDGIKRHMVSRVCALDEYSIVSYARCYNTSSTNAFVFFIQPSRSTRSSSTQPFCYLVTEIFQSLHSRSCHASLEQTPSQHCDKYLNHLTSSLKPLPLKSFRGSFTPN